MKLKGFNCKVKLNKNLVKKISIFASLTLVMCLGFLAYNNLVNGSGKLKKVDASGEPVVIYTSSEGFKYTTNDIVKYNFGGSEHEAKWTNGNLTATVIRFHATRQSDVREAGATSITLWPLDGIYDRASSKFGVFTPNEEYMLLITGTSDGGFSQFNTYKIDDKFLNVSFTGIDEVDLDDDYTDWKTVPLKSGGETYSVTPWTYFLSDSELSKITTGIIGPDSTGSLLDGTLLFAGLKNLKDVRFDKYVDELGTETKRKMHNAQGMFADSGIEKLDFSNFDFSTYKITNADELFYHCANLVDFDSFNLNFNANCSYIKMFEGCTNLRTINFNSSPLDAFSGTDAYKDCTNLEYLDISRFTYSSESFEEYTKLKWIRLPKISHADGDPNPKLPEGTWNIYSNDGTKITVLDPDTGLETDHVSRMINIGTSSVTPSGKTALYLVRGENKNPSELKLGEIVELGAPNDSNLNEKYRWRVVAFRDLDGDETTGEGGLESPLLMLDDWYSVSSDGFKVVAKTQFDSRANNAYDPSDLVNTHLDGRTEDGVPFDEGDYTPNRYATSDIRKFLNSNEQTGLTNYADGYTPDGVNALGNKGFLANFNGDEDYIKTAAVNSLSGYAQIEQGMCITKNKNASFNPPNSNRVLLKSTGGLFSIYDSERFFDADLIDSYNKSYSEVTYDKVFLPSLEDMYDIINNSKLKSEGNGWDAEQYVKLSLANSLDSSNLWNQNHVRSFWLRDAGSLTTVGTFIYNLSKQNFIWSGVHVDSDNVYYRLFDDNYFSVKMKEVRESFNDGYDHLSSKLVPATDDVNRGDDYNEFDGIETYDWYKDLIDNKVDRMLTGIVPCLYLKDETVLNLSCNGAYQVNKDLSNGALSNKEYAKPVTLENDYTGTTKNDELRPRVYIENPDGAFIDKVVYTVYKEESLSRVIHRQTQEILSNDLFVKQDNEISGGTIDNDTTYWIQPSVTSTIDGISKTIDGVPCKVTTGKPIVQVVAGTEGSTSTADSLTFKYRVLSLMGAKAEAIRAHTLQIGKRPDNYKDFNHHVAFRTTELVSLDELSQFKDAELFYKLMPRFMSQDGTFDKAAKDIDIENVLISTTDNPVTNSVTLDGLFGYDDRVFGTVSVIYKNSNKRRLSIANYKANSQKQDSWGQDLVMAANPKLVENITYSKFKSLYSHYYNWMYKTTSDRSTITSRALDDGFISFYKETSSWFDDPQSNFSEDAYKYAYFPFSHGGGFNASGLGNPFIEQLKNARSAYTGDPQAGYKFYIDNIRWYEYQKVGELGKAVDMPSSSRDFGAKALSEKSIHKKYAMQIDVNEAKFIYADFNEYTYHFEDIPKDFFEFVGGYDYGQVAKNEPFHSSNTIPDGEKIPVTVYFPRLGPVYMEKTIDGLKDVYYYPDNDSSLEEDSKGRRCLWDISNEGDGSVLAVVFKKQNYTNSSIVPFPLFEKDNKPYVDDNKDILVIYQGNLKEGNGAGEKKTFTHYVSGENKISLSDGLSSSFSDNLINSQDGWKSSGDVIAPWTLYLDENKLEKIYKVVVIDVDITDWSGIFAGLPNLQEVIIDPYKEDTFVRNVTNAYGMFAGSNSVSNLDIRSLDLSNLEENDKNKNFLNSLISLKRVYLPDKLPSFDINLLPSFVVYDKDSNLNNSLGGGIHKLLERSESNNIEYLEASIDAGFIVNLIKTSSSCELLADSIFGNEEIIDFINENGHFELNPEHEDDGGTPQFDKYLIISLLFADKDNIEDIDDVYSDISEALNCEFAFKVNGHDDFVTLKKTDEKIDLQIVATNSNKINDYINDIFAAEYGYCLNEEVNFPEKEFDEWIRYPYESYDGSTYYFYKNDAIGAFHFDFKGAEPFKLSSIKDDDYIILESPEISPSNPLVYINGWYDFYDFYPVKYAGINCEDDYIIKTGAYLSAGSKLINTNNPDATLNAKFWNDYNYELDCDPVYDIPLDNLLSRGTNHITSSSQISCDILNAYMESEDFAYLAALENPDGTLVDGSTTGELEGDKKLYVKVPKKIELEAWYELFDGDIAAEFDTKYVFFKKMNAILCFKNDFEDDYGYNYKELNSVNLNIDDIILKKSDINIDSSTFIYDGNVHYPNHDIDEYFDKYIIQPVLLKGTFTSASEFAQMPQDSLMELMITDMDTLKDIGDYTLALSAYHEYDVTPNPFSNIDDRMFMFPFSIIKKPMTLLNIDDSILSCEYTGSDIDPSSGFVIKDGDTTLDPSTYRITYEDSDGNVVNLPKDIGEYTVIISDKTDTYTGTKEFKFNVVLKQINITDDMFDSNPDLVLTKVYDGLDSYTFDSTATVSGTAVPLKVKVKFDDKNVGENKTVTITVSLNESDKGSYGLTKETITKTNGKITPRPLTFNVSVQDKIYDGTTNANGTPVKNSFSGVISGDNPVVIISNGQFDMKDAGDEITATFDASVDDTNYQVSNTVTGKGNIKKKDLHIYATTDDGEYNEGETIDVHFALETNDLVTGEIVTLSQTSGTGIVQAEGTRKVKKVIVDTWPSLSGLSTVLKNYNEVRNECVVNLTRIDLSGERMVITVLSRGYYDGTPQTVSISIKFPELGVTLVEGTDFTFAYLDDHIEIGTHPIKIEFIGEYKGMKTTDFEIKEKQAPAPTGGGAAQSGPTYTIVPEFDVKNTHLAYMKGYEDNTFRPQNAVTREEVATIVARLDSEFNEDYNFTSFNNFTDSNDKWSKNYIGFCKMKDLVHGYEDGSFHPSSLMTRAELATLVSNFLRVQNADFTDVDLTRAAFKDVEGRWYEEAVNKLASLGILNGYEDGTFKGDKPVTRIEVAIVMNKINGRTVVTEIPDEFKTKVTSIFKDVSSNRWFFNDVVEATVSHPKNLY